jgi:hypothetical protein
VAAAGAVEAVAAVAAAAVVQLTRQVGPPPPGEGFCRHQSRSLVPQENCCGSCTARLQLYATCSCLTDLRGLVKLKIMLCVFYIDFVASYLLEIVQQYCKKRFRC